MGDPNNNGDGGTAATLQQDKEDLQAKVNTLNTVIAFLVIGMLCLCIAANPKDFMSRTTRFKNFVVEETSKKEENAKGGLEKVEKDKKAERRATVTKTKEDGETPVAWKV